MDMLVWRDVILEWNENQGRTKTQWPTKTPGDLHLYKSTTPTRSLLFLWLDTISHLAKITPQ